MMKYEKNSEDDVTTNRNGFTCDTNDRNINRDRKKYKSRGSLKKWKHLGCPITCKSN